MRMIFGEVTKEMAGYCLVVSKMEKGEMMYKISKYNYFTKNAQGDLLLYNTMRGSKSMYKVKTPYQDRVQEVLEGKHPLESVDAKIAEKLISGGFFVPCQDNEEEKLKSIYLDCIGDGTLQLTILPTEQCNFRCRYCYESFPDTYMGQDVQDALIAFLEKNISKYKMLHVAWFGGEPLVALDTILSLSQRMMEVCRSYRKPYSASMTTNAYFLDVDTFRKLMKVNVLYYQITIDGLKETHDFQRPLRGGGSTFQHIIGNLESIRDEVKSKLFRITIRTNFSKALLEIIPEYKKFFGERFGKDARFQFFFRPVMDWGGERVDCFREHLFEEELMEEIYKCTMEAEPKLRFIYDDFLELGGGICEAAKRNHYTIIPDGSIYKCTCDFSNTPGAKIGKLSKEKGMQLDDSRSASWLCDRNNCENVDCFFKPNCLGECCPAQRVLKRPGKVKCPMEKRSLDMVLQLLDSQNQMFQEVCV